MAYTCPQQHRPLGLRQLPSIPATRCLKSRRLPSCENQHSQSSTLFASSRADQTSTSGADYSAQDVDFRKVAAAASVTAVVFTLVAGVQPASAKELIWKPRRHHRHIGEQFGDAWAAEVIAEDEAKQDQMLLERRRKEELQRKQDEEDALRRKAEAEAQRQRLQQMLAESRAEAARGDLPFSVRVAGHEIFPLIFWSGVAAAAWWASRTTLAERFFRRMQGKPSSGRWVYDRSLGGKKVWVEDTNSVSITGPGRPALKDSDFDTLASIAAAASQRLDKPKEFELPKWWNPPPPSYADPSSKALKQEAAGRMLDRIQQAVNVGEDYRLVDIVRLREMCKDGGLEVKPKTVGGRDAIFRAAVEGAVSASMDPTADTDLGGVLPTRFVAGLAGDIGMPEERAVQFVCAGVSRAARLRLVDALKYLKDDNETEALMALIRLASLVENMPVLQPGDAELEMIASSLRGSSSVAERKRIFELFAQMFEPGAAVVAEMLGFDPKLVLGPQGSANE